MMRVFVIMFSSGWSAATGGLGVGVGCVDGDAQRRR